MLARLAASTDSNQAADSEAAIEKYLRSVLAVENILTLDRLRQVGRSFLWELEISKNLKSPCVISFHSEHKAKCVQFDMILIL